MIVVVKVGSSSLTDEHGVIDEAAVGKLCNEVGEARHAGHDIIVVTSGAIAAGLPVLGWHSGVRPRDTATLQAAAAVGQSRLMRVYSEALAPIGVVGGQILLSPNDFFQRRQYLHARSTLQQLLQLGVVPIVNENDAVADDEIRFGDNDRISALVAHAVRAELLVLLTDLPGLFTADPRLDDNASLVEEIHEIDDELAKSAGPSGTNRGSGGMASKLAAARMASHSGVRTVIAEASRPDVVTAAIRGDAGVGTIIHARESKMSARKLWIAYAMPTAGRITVDKGARTALVDGSRSLLAAGVVKVDGNFDAESGVEIIDEQGQVFAKGLTNHSAKLLRDHIGSRTDVLPEDVPPEVVHRDDLVILL